MGNFLYVIDRARREIVVLNSNRFTVLDTIKLTDPFSMAFAPTLALMAGILVLLLECMHCWGEASFGLRASNLSNRGIITNGLFRYFKHPIYFSKCGMWLLWMPFLAGETVLDAIAQARQTLRVAQYDPLFLAWFQGKHAHAERAAVDPLQ